MARWSYTQDPEFWSFASENSRDGAIREGLEEYGGAPFTIGLFHTKLTSFRIDTSACIEDALNFYRCNIEEEIGQDGEHGLNDVTPSANAALQQAIDHIVSIWIQANNITAHNAEGIDHITDIDPMSAISSQISYREANIV